MSEIKTIDARGLSCPQPVMLTSDAIKKMDKGPENFFTAP